MRTACLTLALAAMCLSAASAQPWRTQPILQAVPTPNNVYDVAVAPSGNQIAWVTSGGLSIHSVRDGGGIGNLVKHVNLPDPRRVAFVPGGTQIVCADARGNIHLVHRTTWDVRSINVPDGYGPSGIGVVTQRTEAYVGFWEQPNVAVIDFRNAELVGQATFVCYLGAWFQVDIAVAPAGNSVVIAQKSVGLADDQPRGMFQSFPLPLPENFSPNWNTHMDDVPLAMCVGPDPDHMLALTTSSEIPLRAMRFSDGRFTAPMDFDFDRPADVASSEDGRFIVVVDSGGDFLKTISGADVRGLMDPDFEINIANVRTHTVPLPGNPVGVTLHPNKDVAYTWSDSDNKIWTVRVGLPDV